jgi:hypothetical protein
MRVHAVTPEAHRSAAQIRDETQDWSNHASYVAQHARSIVERPPNDPRRIGSSKDLVRWRTHWRAPFRRTLIPSDTQFDG